jgi:hypothetical protein
MYSYLKQFHRDEGGATATIIALTLTVLIGFAALAIDMSYANSTRTELQVTASAAALAGVQQLEDFNDDSLADNDKWREGAVEYAYRNMALSKHGNILETACGSYTPGGGVTPGTECADVQLGDWDPQCALTAEPHLRSLCFTASTDGAVEHDAVRVYAHRNQTNRNPLGLFLAPVIGLAEQDINVSATAWATAYTGDDCYQRGIIAEEWVDMDGDNTFVDGVCVYGDRGVKYQSDNCFQGGDEDPQPPELCGEPKTAEYGMQVMTCSEECDRGPGEWDEQGGPNPGMDDAQAYGSRDPALAELQALEGFVSAVEAGFFDNTPPGSWGGEYDYEKFADPDNMIGPVVCAESNGCSMPSSGKLVPGTIYDLRNGTADIPQDVHSNVAIIADVITLQSGSTLTNAVLMAKHEVVIDGNIDKVVIASRDLVKLGSDIVVGDPNLVCPENVTVAIYSQGQFTIQSDVTVANTQLITGNSIDTLDLQSNNNYYGVTIQSNGNINLGSDNFFRGCPTGTLDGPKDLIAGLLVRLVD